MKAIETKYKGYRFRSRLEARWAVFFDALNLPWEYEREGYELKDRVYERGNNHDSGTEVVRRYLPDFWLPRSQMFVEVKGAEPTEEEIRNCRLLADQSGFAVLLVVGLPYEKPSLLFAWDVTESSGGSYENLVTFYFHKKLPGLCVHEDSRVLRDRDVFLTSDFDNQVEHLVSAPFRPSLTLQGASAARSARFEHGEHPG